MPTAKKILIARVEPVGQPVFDHVTVAEENVLDVEQIQTWGGCCDETKPFKVDFAMFSVRVDLIQRGLRVIP